MSELVLVPVARHLEQITTAVLYAKEARKYLRISSAAFHALIRNGALPQYHHIGGRRPFFLKHDLDAYLRTLPRYKITPRELGPNS